MQDCECCVAECGFYLRDTGGYGKVLIGGDLYLDECSQLPQSRGCIEKAENRDTGPTRKPLP